MYAHDPIVWLSWRCSSWRVLNFGMILHKLSSNFMHAVLTDGIINCLCRFYLASAPWRPWMAWFCGHFVDCAHGGFCACSGRGDIAKLNFTLDALNAKDPFATRVSVGFACVMLALLFRCG